MGHPKGHAPIRPAADGRLAPAPKRTHLDKDTAHGSANLWVTKGTGVILTG
jgi:hypothetical protein